MENKYIYLFITFLVLAAVSYGGLQFRKNFIEPSTSDPNHQNIVIQKYLLNDSPLYGNNKPKLWIHTNYEINARNWRFSASRNNRALNQPLIQLTIKTIVDHCAQDFNICLIDDTVFKKIVPGWCYGDVGDLPNPKKARIRLLGLLSIIHIYGGLVVPNSFICMKSLLPLYDGFTSHDGDHDGKPDNQRVLIGANRHGQPSFYFFGAKKNNPGIQRSIDIITHSLRVGGVEYEFPNNVINPLAAEGALGVIDGAFLGVQTQTHKPVLLDDLMGQSPIDLIENPYGIYVPDDELLSRTRYSWLAETDDVLNTDVIVAKYLAESLHAAQKTREFQADNADKYRTVATI